MSIIKTDPMKAQAFAAVKRVTELKKLLADSDYKLLLDYDRRDGVESDRQTWREEIRALSPLIGEQP